MKRILIIMLGLISFALAQAADVYHFNAYRYYEKGENSRSYVDKGSVDIDITINLERDFINVGTKRTQYYFITNYENTYTDSDGDTVCKMSAIDEEDIKCTVRFIIRKSGVAQLYIDYSNISWCYSMK